MFQETNLQRLPYNQLVELAIGFQGGDNGYGSLDLCESFNDIELQIIATCEMPTPNSQVYQYGIDSTSNTGAISYDSADRLYAANSTATLSVSWKNPGYTYRRNALEVENTGEDSELEKIKAELTGLKAEMGVGMEGLKRELMESVGTTIKELVGQLTSAQSAVVDSSLSTAGVLTPAAARTLLWSHLHTDSWLLDAEHTHRTLEQLGVETEKDLALLEMEHLQVLAGHFTAGKIAMKPVFLSALGLL